MILDLTELKIPIRDYVYKYFVAQKCTCSRKVTFRVRFSDMPSKSNRRVTVKPPLADTFQKWTTF